MVQHVITTFLSLEKEMEKFESSFEEFNISIEFEDLFGQDFEKNKDYKKLAQRFSVIESELSDLHEIINDFVDDDE